jgi:NAD(P)-dependent dehydrogenase (short-subunit alcohol dehydrogenase family)
MTMKQFQDKVAVITGAGGGFGREFARKGAKLGMKLVLADVQMDALEATRSELEQAGAQVVAQRCDVSLASEVQALADTAMARFGAVHLLFNNAGVGSGGLVWENSETDWQWVLGVNLWGVIHGVRIFTPLMLACAKADPAYQGHIVNTASMAGVLNAPLMGVYNVSKHAVVSLSESLYHDLQLVGAPIATSVLCPYFVPTGISSSHRNRPDELASSPTASQMAAQSMVGKAVSSSKVTALEVAEMTFAAIEGEQFYIYSHPHALANLEQRMREMVGQTNPGDPYQATPHIRELLRESIKGKGQN